MRNTYTETADEVWYKGNWSRRWPDRKAGPWLLDCRFDMTQRGARLTALTIRPTTTWPRPDLAPRITQRVLRDISVGGLMQEWAAQRQGDLSEEYPVEAQLVNKVARRERPSSGRDKVVQETYRKALSADQHPTKAVANALDINVKHAAVLVARARQRGYLKRAPGHGRQGEV